MRGTYTLVITDNATTGAYFELIRTALTHFIAAVFVESTFVWGG
jgi:hypothetical protein